MPPKFRPLKTKAEVSITSNPPSHSHEHNPQHRDFLKRSLDRSDKELAALQTLHRSLHSLKNIITKNYGEAVLLDIGEGLIHISEEDQSLVVPKTVESSSNVDDKFQPIVKDFILRMKLRRKLMNRLARRMMRLSHAMDGRITKVNPPAVPKYGEFRMLSSHADYEAGLKKFEEDFLMKEALRKKIDKAIEESAASRSKEEEEKKKQEADITPVSNSTVQTKDEDNKDDGAVDTDMKKEEKEEPESTPNGDKKEESDEAEAEAVTSSEPVEQKVKDEEPETLVETMELDPLLFNIEHQADLEKLIETDTEYSKKKVVDMTTSKSKIMSALSEDDLQSLDKTEEDFEFESNIKGSIGATIVNMSNREKLNEYNRWKNEFLSKIPDQPSFSELGMKNRVFCLEERRKRVQVETKVDDENKEQDNMKAEKKTVAEDVEMKDADEDGTDADEDGTDADDAKAVVKKEQSETENESSEDKDGASSAQNAEDKKMNGDDSKMSDQKDESLDEFAKKKSFSLDPIPSFHDQDYQRCIMIQADILSSSVQEKKKKSIAEATHEYNKAFKMSSEFQNTKLRLEAEEKMARREYRVKLELWDASRQMAYAKWQNEKKNFESHQAAKRRLKYQAAGANFQPEYSLAMQMGPRDIARRSLSGVVDRVVIRNAPKEQARGTDYTSSCMASNNAITSEVATCLAHCVDAVVNRTERGWISTTALDEAGREEQFPPFQFSQSTSITLNERGETLEQIQARVSQQIKQVTKQLENCETVRAQKWSILMKVKAEAEGTSVQPAPRRVQQKKATTAPMDRAALARMQQQYSGATTSNYQATAANVYNQMKATAVAGQQRMSLDNKYSAEAVRARMSSDGSVRPINTPKMTQDGLFMRPAGRQRKGMDWDAVNGKWVPEGSLR